MKNTLVVILTAAAFLCSSCMEKRTMPDIKDGRATLSVVTLADTSLDPSVVGWAPVANARIILSCEFGTKEGLTDEYGLGTITQLPANVYGLSARAKNPLDPSIFFVGTKDSIILHSGFAVAETLKLQPVKISGLVINEIYAAGPINNSYYFYDQFIELYNAGTDVRYVDGMMVMRVSGNNDGKGPGADERGDGNMQGVTYAYKFPGSPGGTQYPVQPGQFIVLASTGTDHRKFVSQSYDLSRADWEFYNAYSATDLNNPNVPNLINMQPEKTVDFLINLSGDVIALASGEDSIFVDGIKISTVVDAVEYHSSITAKKTLDPRIDKSFTLSPPKYSGQSMQRRSPGMDSNNARFDFEIKQRATPGAQ